MKDPKIVVGLSDAGDREVLVVKRTDGRDILHYLAWDISEIEHEGYVAMCQRIGNAVLRMLATAHEDFFRKHPLVAPPVPNDANVEAIVLHLIHMTNVQRTKTYIESIDELIKRNPDEFKNSSIAESWIQLRKTALTFR